jgi:amidase/aspartyl-tRNA(Asn)/glutamyl-tRNA(Gln) amidotransferase subunit A
MTFRDWQELTPAAAARTLRERVQTRLAPAQQRAAIAQLFGEADLRDRFAPAHRAPAAALTAIPAEAGSAAGQPLAGVPYFAKDLFDVGGMPTLAGSTFLPEVRGTPANDSAFVRAMTAAGAVLAGKAHMHEFAYGITGENPHYGDCEHPRFPGRTTGGSSSGSAELVAAGVVPLALGSDTGGSVRLPAAFCGLFGFRLEPRDPWISDAVALAPSFDTAGWFTVNATDMRTTIDALVGLSKSARAPRGCYLELPGLEADVARACAIAAEGFAAAADATVREELRQAFAPAVEAYNTTVALEAWEVHRGWAEHYRNRYSEVVWQRLNRVHAITPRQVEAADTAIVAIRAVWRKFFEAYDFLVLPASPMPALTKAECTLENRTRILALTTPASIGGLPVLTVPVALLSGLTTGLQIVVREPRSAVVNWALERAAQL